MTAPLLIVTDPHHADHAAHGHPERPARVQAIDAAIQTDNTLAAVPRVLAEPALDADLLRVHTQAHIDAVHAICEKGGGWFDADTYAAPESDEIARRSVGAALHATDEVATNQVAHAFVLARPPGPHATASVAMGFCLYNAIAIAARRAQQEHGISRIAILDIDVHHGNGTQEIFWDDPATLYCSLHQWPFYPGTGAASESGGADALGTTLNIPLHAGTDAQQWLARLDTDILPAMDSFEPEMIMVSCGFDAHEADPLAQLRLQAQTYAEVAQRVRIRAGGRSVWILEGGYDLTALGDSSRAVLSTLVQG